MKSSCVFNILDPITMTPLFFLTPLPEQPCCPRGLCDSVLKPPPKLQHQHNNNKDRLDSNFRSSSSKLGNALHSFFLLTELSLGLLWAQAVSLGQKKERAGNVDCPSFWLTCVPPWPWHAPCFRESFSTTIVYSLGSAPKSWRMECSRLACITGKQSVACRRRVDHKCSLT